MSATAAKSEPKLPKLAKDGTGPAITRPSWLMFSVMCVVALYFLIPLWWFLVSATKSQSDLFTTFPFWFSKPQPIKNFVDTINYDGGSFVIWTRNSLLYSVVGGLLSTLVSTMAGYAIAKYQFKGRNFVFDMVLAATLMPLILLTIPLYLLFSEIGLVNTPWAIILPVIINPFGIYLCRIYAETIPNDLIEAGRIDGASEWQIFWRIGVRIMSPALVTVFLIKFVGIWANFFLPMMMVSSPQWQPLSVGIVNWQETQQTGAAVPTNLVIFGAFLSVLPIILLFLFLQRYWREGLTAGSVKA